jgi:hypothetical protein
MRDVGKEAERHRFVFPLGLLWRSFNTSAMHPANKLLRAKTMK